MFARLGGASARELVRALEKAGFDIIRQKGSHITLYNPETNKTTLVAMHPGELPRWLFKKIIKDAGFTEDEFRSFL
jgi:predicted RNA binding protein YcfA (HicA-like mRNA interferase family)